MASRGNATGRWDIAHQRAGLVRDLRALVAKWEADVHAEVAGRKKSAAHFNLK